MICLYILPSPCTTGNCLNCTCYFICTTWNIPPIITRPSGGKSSSTVLFCMCCVAGCFIDVHVHVLLHVQLHVLVMCRCSAGACVVRVQRPGLLWSLYVYKLFFPPTHVFCIVSFFATLLFLFFLFFIFFCTFLCLSNFPFF